jgi:hypothetical protein
MVHEINTLAKALIKNEKKMLKMQTAFKTKLKEYKRAARDREHETGRYELENKALQE